MVLGLNFTHLWRLTVEILPVHHWICLLLLRSMCATSVRTWLTLPLHRWRPHPVTVTACFYSTLTKSLSQQNLCCSSASISQVPWASPSRWKPTNWRTSVVLLWQTASANTSGFLTTFSLKVTEKEGVVHRSRLHVSFSSFSFTISFHVNLKEQNFKYLTDSSIWLIFTA